MIDSLNKVLEAFKIKAKCTSASRHRHFGFFDVKLLPGCKVTDVTKLAREISLELCTKTIISFKLIPDLGVIRLQAIMDNPETLHFERLLEENREGSGILPMLLGETEEGDPLFMDMSENPHVLIAGCTGSGKSALIHLMIANAAKVPNCEIFLVDPKLVEFTPYKKWKPVKLIADSYDKTIELLKYLIIKMEKRYLALSKFGLRSIEEKPEIFTKTLLIIDEVSDLILQDKDGQLEELIISLAQKARAAGIYIVLSTQRPSVNTLTGLIKANFPGRIACKVASKQDSLIILDEQGAENLIGRGDAVIKSPRFSSVRFQVALANPKQTVKSTS